MGKRREGTLINLSPAKLRLLRIYEIDRHVRSGAYPSAKDLAAILEVHHRTVHRDIDFLNKRLGAPIEYDPLRRGWRYTEPGFSLASLELPEPEREALESARRYLARLVASSLGEDVESLFESLSGEAGKEERGPGAEPTSESPDLPEAAPTAAAATDSPIYEVSLLFRGTAASTVASRTWQGDQKLELFSDGSVRLRMTAPLSEALERWVLGWADEVIIESPGELAAVITARQRRALRRQGRTGSRRSTGPLDPALVRAQVPLDFENEDSRPATRAKVRKAVAALPEQPVQSDFGFKGRSSRRKRRKK